MTGWGGGWLVGRRTDSNILESVIELAGIEWLAFHLVMAA